MSFEELSNRNMVGFYEEELVSGDLGDISMGARMRMHKLGILRRERAPHARLVLTEYGEGLLGEAKK